MKTLLPLVIIIILTYACKQDQASSKSDKSNEPDKTIIAPQADSKQLEKLVYKTTSGKNIELILEKKDDGLSDFTIVAVDFQNSTDSLAIKGSDPLQEVAIKDLDANGYDELYLITTSVGSGSYASVFGFASNQDLSLTTIYVPDISENDVQIDGSFHGYMGHDSIYFSNNRMYRKFPVYKEGDANCCPTGGDKTLSYQLKAGEATWKLEIEN